MDWKLHIIFSFFLYFLIISLFPLTLIYSLQALFLLLFSSLLPDLDHPKSVIRGVIFIITFYFLVLFVMIQKFDFEIKVMVLIMVLFLLYYFYRNIPLKHRGRKSLHLWRHCFLFTGIFFVLFSIENINISLTSFIFIGYGSHLLADGIKKF